MREVAVEGTKGAGKTTALAATRGRLEAAGLSVAAHAPFARGNARHPGPGGLFARWADPADAREAMAWMLADLDAARAAASGADVLLHDRHWITALRALEDSALPPRERDGFAAAWRRAAPPTVFLHCAPALTLERRAGALDARSGLWSPALVERDHALRMAIAGAAAGVVLLDAPAHGAEDVADAVAALLAGPGPAP